MGDTTNAGTALIQLSDPQDLQVRSTVTEEDYRLIQIGQAAQIYLDAQPELVLSGKVTRIVPLRETGSASPIYPIYIQLDQVPTGIAPGMTADASIQIAKRASVLRLPRALAHANADGIAQVQVWNEARGQSQVHQVQIGLRGNQYVEIVNGLREGEQVVSR